MNENLDVKLSIEHHGTVVNVTCKSSSIDDVIDSIKGMLVTVGYHPKLVDNCFDDTSNGCWFTEDQELQQLETQAIDRGNIRYPADLDGAHHVVKTYSKNGS